jgi:hypothetical protein
VISVLSAALKRELTVSECRPWAGHLTGRASWDRWGLLARRLDRGDRPSRWSLLSRARSSDEARVRLERMDERLVDAASSLVQARTDDANHTTAAAGRTTKGLIVTGMNVFHFTGGPAPNLS